MCRALYTVCRLRSINPQRMRFRHSCKNRQWWPLPLPSSLALSPLASFRRSWDDSGFFSTLRVCMLSCQLPCAFLWYPLTLWLAKLVCQCLDPSEQLAAILYLISDMQYCSVYFSLAPKFCIIVLQDVLKKLANINTVPKSRL